MNSACRFTNSYTYSPSYDDLNTREPLSSLAVFRSPLKDGIASQFFYFSIFLLLSSSEKSTYKFTYIFIWAGVTKPWNQVRLPSIMPRTGGVAAYGVGPVAVSIKMAMARAKQEVVALQ